MTASPEYTPDPTLPFVVEDDGYLHPIPTRYVLAHDLPGVRFLGVVVPHEDGHDTLYGRELNLFLGECDQCVVDAAGQHVRVYGVETQELAHKVKPLPAALVAKQARSAEVDELGPEPTGWSENTVTVPVKCQRQLRRHPTGLSRPDHRPASAGASRTEDDGDAPLTPWP